MSDTKALACCPFCGGANVKPTCIHVDLSRFYGRGSGREAMLGTFEHFVYCSDCGTADDHQSLRAAELWDVRTP